MLKSQIRSRDSDFDAEFSYIKDAQKIDRLHDGSNIDPAI